MKTLGPDFHLDVSTVEMNHPSKHSQKTFPLCHWLLPNLDVCLSHVSVSAAKILPPVTEEVQTKVKASCWLCTAALRVVVTEQHDFSSMNVKRFPNHFGLASIVLKLNENSFFLRRPEWFMERRVPLVPCRDPLLDHNWFCLLTRRIRSLLAENGKSREDLGLWERDVGLEPGLTASPMSL